MNTKVETTTSYLVTIKLDGSDEPMVLTFPTFVTASEYLAEAMDAGFAATLTKLVGQLPVRESSEPKAPAKSKARKVKKAKAQPKAAEPVAEPVKSDKSDEPKFRLVITTGTGRVIRIKGNDFVDVAGEERAQKYADRCRAQGKTVTVTAL